ncbi:MAG: hypothetical protein IJC73_07220 [Lentisphaeria bacterium]|nr:hypothetical protein [Lentisphaeria bacterium]
MCNTISNPAPTVPPPSITPASPAPSILITDIAAACGIGEPIRTSTDTGSVWRKMDYETMNGIRGTMIFAPTCGHAEPLRMSLPVCGRCRIYLGIAAYGSKAGLFLRLGNETAWRSIRGDHTDYFPEILEYFYREADLDGCDLFIKRYPEISSLAWVRLEPVASPPRPAVPAFETLITQDGYNTATFEDYLDKIEPLKEIRTGKFFFCFAQGDSCLHHPTRVGTHGCRGTTDFGRQIDRDIVEAVADLTAKHPDFIPELIREVHGRGMEFHASVRTGAFYLPGFPLRSGFFIDHPEYHCRLRNGTEVERVSLAIPEVRQHFLALFREIMSFDCDGLHLILNRALPFVLFEPAFCERFEQRYGISPLTLPDDDARIMQLRQEIVTDFMRDVRAMLDECGAARSRHLQLTLTVPATGERNLFFGLDLRLLATAGIVDNITADGALLTRYHDEHVSNIDFDYFQQAVQGTNCRWYPRAPGRTEELTPFIRRAFASHASGVLVWDGCESAIPRAEYWEALTDLMHHPDSAAADYPVRRLFPLRTLDGLDWDQYTPHNGF